LTHLTYLVIVSSAVAVSRADFSGAEGGDGTSGADSAVVVSPSAVVVSPSPVVPPSNSVPPSSVVVKPDVSAEICSCALEMDLAT